MLRLRAVNTKHNQKITSSITKRDKTKYTKKHKIPCCSKKENTYPQFDTLISNMYLCSAGLVLRKSIQGARPPPNIV